MLPTFFGTTLLVFVILAYVPGGPFQRAVMQLKQQQMSGGGEVGGSGGTGIGKSNELPPEVLDKLKKQFGLDKPLLIRYLSWLGLYPRETKSQKVELGEAFRENLEFLYTEDGDVFEMQRWTKVEKEGDGYQIYVSGAGTDFPIPGTDYPVLPEVGSVEEWYTDSKWKIGEEKNGEINVIKTGFSGILTGDLGTSYVYDEPVSKLIKERLHISVYFGLISFFLTYLVCIPLGIIKGIKNGSSFDILSSVLIFIGYSIPGFALGALLLVLFGGGSFWDVFPLGGFRSDSATWEQLSLWGKIMDQLHHTFLPVICYMVGAFATLTILMKNSLLENLSSDYIRTAFAKGLTEKAVIVKHAVRNSLIPLVARIGGIIGIFFAGSVLIEKIFNIKGIALLSFDAILMTDYPIFLGFLVIGILIRIVGNLISDLALVLVDPRVNLE